MTIEQESCKAAVPNNLHTTSSKSKALHIDVNEHPELSIQEGQAKAGERL